jgi:hypothetical protein
MIPFRRLLTRGPSDDPLWVRLHIFKIGERWAAMILADDVQPSGAEELKEIALFGETAEEAEREALDYIGLCAERN